MGEKIKIITIWGTEDDNGLLYVFTAQCKKEEGKEEKKGISPYDPHRLPSILLFFLETFFKTISG